MKVVSGVVVSVCAALSLTCLGISQQAQANPAVTESFVSRICADGGAWLWCTTLNPSACSEFARSVVEPCVDRVRTMGHMDAPVNLLQEVQVSAGVDTALRTRYRAIRKNVTDCSQLPIQIR